MPQKLSACPGWLKLSEDRTSFVFLPDRAKIVRHIFELSIARLGGYTIAKQLNAKNVPPFGPSPKWDQSTINNMLRNRATIGEHQPKRYKGRTVSFDGDPIPDYYPAVIDEVLFDAAQRARQKNLASGRGRKGRLITNLFAGIPTCAYCASVVKFHSNGNAKSLICARVIERSGCYRQGWSYRDFEELFFDFVVRHEADPTIAAEERESMAALVTNVTALSGPDVYDARLAIAIILKGSVAELRIACAGANPTAGKPDARIQRDVPGRYFEIRFRGGAPHVIKSYAAPASPCQR
jgi:hypothetical protein